MKANKTTTKNLRGKPLYTRRGKSMGLLSPSLEHSILTDN